MNEQRMKHDRVRARRWAASLLERQNWALINTQTTDLYGVVCEIGVIAPDGSILFESLINPERPVSEGARALHGLSDEVLATAPTLKQVWDDLQKALDGRTILVAYGAAFHRNRLRQSCARSQLPMLPQDWLCVMGPYAAYCGNWSEYHRSYTLVKLPGATHRSVADARAARAVIHTMSSSHELGTEKGS